MTKAAKAAVQTVGEDEARQMLALCVLGMLPDQWVVEMTAHVEAALRSLKKDADRGPLRRRKSIDSGDVIRELYADGKGEGWKPLNMIAALTEEIEKVCGK
jgi:hypothetical protein